MTDSVHNAQTPRQEVDIEGVPTKKGLKSQSEFRQPAKKRSKSQEMVAKVGTTSIEVKESREKRIFQE